MLGWRRFGIGVVGVTAGLLSGQVTGSRGYANAGASCGRSHELVGVEGDEGVAAFWREEEISASVWESQIYLTRGDETYVIWFEGSEP